MNDDHHPEFLEWLAAERGEEFDPTDGEGNLPDRNDE